MQYSCAENIYAAHISLATSGHILAWRLCQTGGGVGPALILQFYRGMLLPGSKCMLSSTVPSHGSCMLVLAPLRTTCMFSHRRAWRVLVPQQKPRQNPHLQDGGVDQLGNPLSGPHSILIQKSMVKPAAVMRCQHFTAKMSERV